MLNGDIDLVQSQKLKKKRSKNESRLIENHAERRNNFKFE